MEKYVAQLLEDLENAKTKKPPKPDLKALYPGHPAFKYGLDYIAEWEMAPAIPLPELFSVEGMAFPSPDKLSTQQLQDLSHKILELWYSYHIDTVIPDGVPIELVYKALTEYWKEETIHYVSEGWMTIEFCTYEVESCPWGEAHCTCKDLIAEWEEEAKNPKVYTKEEEEHWEKGRTNLPGGGISWVNPDLLDENGKLDPSKIKGLFPDNKDDLPF